MKTSSAPRLIKNVNNMLIHFLNEKKNRLNTEEYREKE